MGVATRSVIEEFLRSGESQKRKNALVTLAVLGDQDSVALIAETALDDPDVAVRQRAEEEIMGLDDSSRQAAIRLLAQGLKSSDADKQGRAYSLLGTLRSRGAEVRRALLPRRGRLRLAFSMNSHLYPTRSWSYGIRGWRPASFGTLVGLLVLFIDVLITYRGWNAEEAAYATPLFLIVFVAGTLLALCSTQFTVPFGLQLDRIAALAVEVLMSALASLAGAAILLLLTGILLSALERPARTLPLVLPLGLLGGPTRVGTLIALAGLRRIRLFSGRTLVFLGQVLSGSLVGSVSTMLLFLLFRIGYGPGEVRAVFLGYFAVALGLASAFAAIDKEGAPSDHFLHSVAPTGNKEP
jgi:hypothetical protein